MNAFEAKREARIERMRQRAARQQRVADSRIGAAHRTLDNIPLGQPIISGHHSERRHRRDLAKAQNNLTKGFEVMHEAKELERRADAAEASTAISSDDPNAIVKLREKLAGLEASQELMKRGNAILRKADKIDEALTRRHGTDKANTSELLLALGLTEPTVDRAMRRDFSKHYNGFNVAGGGVEIRRVKARIEELEKRASAPAKEPLVVANVRVVEEENRVRIYFPGKPGEDVRRELKAYGFRWSPTVGAWQAYASPTAWDRARRIVAGIVSPASIEPGTIVFSVSLVPEMITLRFAGADSGGSVEPIALVLEREPAWHGHTITDGRKGQLQEFPKTKYERVCNCFANSTCDISHDPAECACGRCNPEDTVRCARCTKSILRKDSLGDEVTDDSIPYSVPSFCSRWCYDLSCSACGHRAHDAECKGAS